MYTTKFPDMHDPCYITLTQIVFQNKIHPSHYIFMIC